MDLFEIWLEGVKIILPFILIGVAMLGLTALILYAFDLLFMTLLEELFGRKESLICIIFFNCENYDELKEKIRKKKEKRDERI